jgi:hypothetical protein
MQQHKINLEVKQLKTLKWLKIGIWGYILLLIFEGALRKWFLPSLATPLLVVRDPIAIWLIYTSWRYNLMPSNIFMTAMSLIGVLAIITALIFGHGNIPVAIYGARLLLVHFPLMFVIGSVFDNNDVQKVGQILLLFSIPMIVLITLQFYNPQSAWVNRGVGGDMEGAGFSGAMGYFRPPGTFSFTNGNTMFFTLVSCFVFYFWISKAKISKLILISATFALLASIPMSISRTLMFSIVITVIFALIAASTQAKYFYKILGSFLFMAMLLLVLMQTPVFQKATKVFTTRIELASKVEGGIGGTLVDRYLGDLLNAIAGGDSRRESKAPFFGYGIGMGTNVGSKILTGDRAFLIAEEEWARLIGETGTMLGLMIILVRLIFSLKLSLLSFKQMRKGDFLPWMLLAFGLIIIPQGQWAQPTTLGFSTLIGGLILASLNKSKGIEVDRDESKLEYK